MNIELPEVQAMQQTARFFNEEGKDLIEIGFVGSKDTVKRRVTPEHMAKFRPEWLSYKDGVPLSIRPGTALSELGLDEVRTKHYIDQQVHNAEELAALSDIQCQQLGHGTLTLRKKAQDHIALKAMERETASRDAVIKASASINNKPAEAYASVGELTEVKTQIAELSQNVAALVATLSRKPGRPKKEAE